VDDDQVTEIGATFVVVVPKSVLDTLNPKSGFVERLGHDSVQTTLELYGHVTPKMRGNAAARFGSLLNAARVIPAEAMTAES
jgi:sorbitol-specific phosphotransferase system component IIA